MARSETLGWCGSSWKLNALFVNVMEVLLFSLINTAEGNLFWYLTGSVRQVTRRVGSLAYCVILSMTINKCT
jgi:hypothetical protein